MRNFTEPRPRINRNPGSSRFVIAWGILAAVGGIALAATTLEPLRRESEQSKWPVAPGRIASVQTTPCIGADGELIVVRRTAYVFDIDGRTVRSELAETMPRAAWAKQVRAEDSRGELRGSVPVHFNPADPGQSWIQRDPVPLDSVILGFVLFLSGIVVVFVGLRARRVEEGIATEGEGRIIAPPEGPRRWNLTGVLPAV